MIKQTLFILWDETDGYNPRRVYLDKESAEIGLNEHFTEFWIYSGKAKIEEMSAVSYVRNTAETK